MASRNVRCLYTLNFKLKSTCQQYSLKCYAMQKCNHLKQTFEKKKTRVAKFNGKQQNLVSESKNGKPYYIAINVESTVRKRQIEDQFEKHQLLPCFALILKRC